MIFKIAEMFADACRT